MNKKDIVDAWRTIRETNSTIPNDVLDLMKDGAITLLDKISSKNEINNDWLTEEYLDSLGYYKIKDDGQYGEYKNKHWVVVSLTYKNLPKDYRELIFNRDPKRGVFLSVGGDWSTRHSIKNALATSKEVFETLLNASI